MTGQTAPGRAAAISRPGNRGPWPNANPGAKALPLAVAEAGPPRERRLRSPLLKCYCINVDPPVYTVTAKGALHSSLSEAGMPARGFVVGAAMGFASLESTPSRPRAHDR